MDLIPEAVTNKNGCRGAVLRLTWDQMCYVWWREGTRLLEYVLSGFTFNWGGWALTHAVWFRRNPSYAYLVAHGSPQFWGGLACSIALCRVIGATFMVRPLRIGASALGSYLWGMMAVGVYLVEPESAALWVFGWYAAVSFFLTVRNIVGGRGWRSPLPSP